MPALRTQLVQREPKPWPRAAGWLVPGIEYGVPGANTTWLRYLIVRRSERDDGILEQPWASNRGTRLDRMADWAGIPRGSWWCGLWVGRGLIDCGSLVPGDYPATDAFVPHLTDEVGPGSGIVYGIRKASGPDAHHIGLVTRTRIGQPGVAPRFDIITREGNRGYAGTASNNGVAVDQGPIARRDVLGFFDPRPVPGWRVDDFAPLELLVEHFHGLPPDVQDRTRARLRALAR